MVVSKLFSGAMGDSVSPQGASFVSLDASYPPGTYRVVVAGSSPHEWTFAKHGGRPAPRTPPD